MSNSINPGSVNLGGSVPQYYAEYYPTYGVGNPKPANCALPPAVDPVITPTKLLDLNQACVFQFPDVTPIPPVYNPPYVPTPACTSLDVVSDVKTTNSSRNSYLTLTSAGPSNCLVTLSGVIDSKACETYTASANIAFKGAADTPNSKLTVKASSEPNCGLDIYGVIDVNACTSIPVDTSKITFSGASKGSSLIITSAPAPSCGLTIGGNINTVACETFDASVNINVTGSAVSKSTFNITPSSQPSCGFKLNGDVVIDACQSFGLNVLQGHSPTITVVDFNGTKISNATMTSTLSVTGTACEKFIKLDFSDITIAIPPPVFTGSGGSVVGGPVRSVNTANSTATQKCGGGTGGVKLSLSKAGELSIAGTLPLPCFKCGTSSDSDTGDIYKSIEIGSISVDSMKSSSCCPYARLDGEKSLSGFDQNTLNICSGEVSLVCNLPMCDNIFDFCTKNPQVKFLGAGYTIFEDTLYRSVQQPDKLEIARSKGRGQYDYNYARLDFDDAADPATPRARLNIENSTVPTTVYSTSLEAGTFWQGLVDSDNYIDFPGITGATGDDAKFRIIVSNNSTDETRITGTKVYIGSASQYPDAYASITKGYGIFKNSDTDYLEITGGKLTSSETADKYTTLDSAYLRIQAAPDDYTLIEGGTITSTNPGKGAKLTLSPTDLWLKNSDTEYTHLDGSVIYLQSANDVNVDIEPGKLTLKKAANDYTSIAGREITCYVSDNEKSILNAGYLLCKNTESDYAEITGAQLFLNKGTAGNSTLAVSSLNLSDGKDSGSYQNTNFSIVKGTNTITGDASVPSVEIVGSSGKTTISDQSVKFTKGAAVVEYKADEIKLSSTDSFSSIASTKITSSLTSGGYTYHTDISNSSIYAYGGGDYKYVHIQGANSGDGSYVEIHDGSAAVGAKINATALSVYTSTTNKAEVKSDSFQITKGTTVTGLYQNSLSLSAVDGDGSNTAAMDPTSLTLHGNKSTTTVTLNATNKTVVLTAADNSHSTLGTSSLALGTGSDHEGKYNTGDLSISSATGTITLDTSTASGKTQGVKVDAGSNVKSVLSASALTINQDNSSTKYANLDATNSKLGIAYNGDTQKIEVDAKNSKIAVYSNGGNTYSTLEGSGKLYLQAGGKTVTLDASALDSGTDVYFQLIDVCVNGNPLKAWVLMSTPA
jgi:hypothetical protein